MTHTGSCLCGVVRFRIDGVLAPIELCYCQQCRKAQGGAFAAVVPVATSAFRFLSGEAMLQAYASSPGKERVFCSRCGSPVFSRRTSRPEVLRVRAGLIEEPIESGIAWHAHTASKCNWWGIEGEGPRCEEGHGP